MRLVTLLLLCSGVTAVREGDAKPDIVTRDVTIENLAKALLENTRVIPIDVAKFADELYTDTMLVCLSRDYGMISREAFLGYVNNNKASIEKTSVLSIIAILTEQYVKKNCEDIRALDSQKHAADELTSLTISNAHFVGDHMKEYVYPALSEACSVGFDYYFSKGQYLAFLNKNKKVMVAQRDKLKSKADVLGFFTPEVFRIHCHEIAHTASNNVTPGDIGRAAAWAIHNSRGFLPDEPEKFAARIFESTRTLCKSHNAAVFTKEQLEQYISKNRYALKASLDKSPSVTAIIAQRTDQLVTILCSSVVHGSKASL